MNQEDYYFVSVGEKSYFYTLNYSYIHINYVKSGIEQRPFPIAERRYTFIRNLSHDFDEAMEKAKAWHEAVKSKNPLKLLESPLAMSERDKNQLLDRIAVISEGIIPCGKYKDQHVSTVEKSYIHWVLLNIYDPELPEGEQNLMAQICYNYAEEQGWIDEWTQNVQASHFGPEIGEELNAIIEGDVFLVGKYKDQSLKDFGYTKKGPMKLKVADYLLWFSRQITWLDNYLKRNEIQPELMEDGNKYYVLKSEFFASTKKAKPTEYDLTVLMARQKINREKNAKHGECLYPLYRFQWGDRVLSLKQALALSTCD